MAAALGLAMSMVSTEVAPGAIDEGVKVLATVGRCSTFSVAVAPAAVPALAVVTLPVGFGYDPAEALVTFTLTVHEPLAGTLAPESARLAPLLAAVTVAPAQVEEPEADAVFTRPAGYVSVKATPVTAAAFGLVSVTVSTLVPLVPMEPGVNASATVRPESTVSVAAAGAVLAPALPEVSAPAAIVFTGAPAA